MSDWQRKRVMNQLAGKAQAAIWELYLTIPSSGNDDIATRMVYDDIRNKLLEAFRASQILYERTSLPPPPYVPCPCGKCDAPPVPSGGAGGTHLE